MTNVMIMTYCRVTRGAKSSKKVILKMSWGNLLNESNFSKDFVTRLGVDEKDSAPLRVTS